MFDDYIDQLLFDFMSMHFKYS